MNSLVTNQIEIRATSVRVSDDALVVDLSDGRTVLAPLAWYPRLLHGTATDLHGVDFTLLAKPQSRMPGISLEQREILIRQLLNMRGELVITLPERLQRV